MKKRSVLLGVALLLTGLGAAYADGRAQVRERAGDVPIIAEADVLVVGGTSGGVAAAVAAARSGARVFLAAPRPYLGEDLCATYRIWLEPDEVPESELAKVVFSTPMGSRGFTNVLGFKYVADQPFNAIHPDNLAEPQVLKDGKWRSASQGSVQYDDDVTLTLDLGARRELAAVHVLAYQRPKDFVVDSVVVETSRNRIDWTPLPAVANSRRGEGSVEQGAVRLTVPVDREALVLRIVVRKTADSSRLLLGEVVVEGRVAPEAMNAKRPGVRAYTPMQIKRGLDRALLDAGVSFLYGCYATDLLVDDSGELSGVVFDNRAGRQAVVARQIIDAVSRATVARMAGAAFADYPAGVQEFQRIVVGGEPREGEGVRVNPKAPAIQFGGADGKVHTLRHYLLRLPMADGSFAAWSEAEQLARDRTWSAGQVDASEVLFQVPPDPLQGGRAHRGAWPGAEQIDLEVFRPLGLGRLWVLGGCARVARSAVPAMLRPLEYMAVGERVGKGAASEVDGLSQARSLKLLTASSAGNVLRSGVASSVGPEANPRHASLTAVGLPERRLPVLGEYDVVVVGGGTGGAPAGIGAGRGGAKTLVVEYLHGLGGVGTLGLISSYYHGNRVGFTAELDRGVARMDGRDRQPSSSWDVEWKMEWYRQALRQADVDIWYGTLGAGAVVEADKVKGVVLATPAGRGVVLAKTVIDATGNAGVAAAAGAPCRYTDGSHIAVQGTGLPPRELGARYVNTDYTFVDESDIADLWRVQLVARQTFEDAYDLGQLVDTRERRQIVGDFTLTPLDLMNHRTYPDTIVISLSNFDTHGFTVHPMFLLRPPDQEDVAVRVPYRCLLPQGLDGILVTGLGVSAHRDAMPVIRMQADIQNQGYAAGTAAAMLSESGQATRDLDVKALQAHLIRKEVLPEGVLTETDSFPLPDEAVAQAVDSLVQGYAGLEMVLAATNRAVPLLQAAYNTTETPTERLVYAHVLGMLGNPLGVDSLLAQVQAANWDEGWDYRGMGQFGASLSRVDSWIIALGRTGDPRAVPILVEKARSLNADSAFSHCRAVAIALESLGNRQAAEALAEVLRQPGMRGHAVTSIAAAQAQLPASRTDNKTRNRVLKELVLARALYRCGDHDGVAAGILREYTADLHGHYARHAHAVLQEGGEQ